MASRSSIIEDDIRILGYEHLRGETGIIATRNRSNGELYRRGMVAITRISFYTSSKRNNKFSWEKKLVFKTSRMCRTMIHSSLKKKISRGDHLLRNRLDRSGSRGGNVIGVSCNDTMSVPDTIVR